jgi:AcrR family transcriptional regulator
MDASMPHDPAPSRRADAERNRDRILAAARAAFAAGDGDVSMAQIARRAGVGQATLYRNFAGRRELLEALYMSEIEAVCAAAAEMSHGEGAGAALEAWLRRFYSYFTDKLPIATELLANSDADDPMFSSGYAQVVAAGRPLLAAALESGDVRSDLTLEQILDMVVAVAKIPGTPDYRAPILQTTLRALLRSTDS